MRRPLKIFMRGDLCVGIYARPELSWRVYPEGIYRLSLGFVTITYWR